MSDFSTRALSHLTAAEREVLRLLATGHPAKSIASATGRSVAAVNERLREARRKTGFGSSRELARALTVQEDRDDNIGLELPPVADPVPNQSTRIPRGRIVGIGIVMTLALIAATGLSLIVADPPAGSPAQDIVAETLQDTDESPHAMRARFRAETRDAAWAAQADAALRAAYVRVTSLGADSQPVIQCAATLCQVAGRSPSNAGVAVNKALMAALQERSLAPAGLQLVASSFATTKEGDAGFSYVTYFRRTTGR